MVDPAAKRPTPDYGERLDELVAAGDRSGAVKQFLRNAIGIPAPFVALMRFMPMWKGMKSTALTLPYDWAALGKHTMYGAALNPEEWASVTMPTLVVTGTKSPAAQFADGASGNSTTNGRPAIAPPSAIRRSES